MPVVPTAAAAGKWLIMIDMMSTPVKRSTVGSRAFQVAGLKTWSALPEDVTSSQFPV